MRSGGSNSSSSRRGPADGKHKRCEKVSSRAAFIKPGVIFFNVSAIGSDACLKVERQKEEGAPSLRLPARLWPRILHRRRGDLHVRDRGGASSFESFSNDTPGTVRLSC